jgi:uncharacterized protein YfaS (alpha-2-macroglobulin family)
MGISEYKAGTCIHLTNEVRNTAEVLTDPDGGVAIYIYDESGNLVVDGEAMAKSEVGKYYYDWQTSENADLGIYAVQARATSGMKVSIEEDSSALKLI